MTNEELLKPRYKVIAHYPCNPYKIGHVFTFDKMHPYSGLSVEFSGNVVAPEYFKNYPHLFQKLEWWEEREEKDMPEYLKFSEEKEDVAIWEVESWNKNVAGVFYPKSKDENGNDFLSIEWYFYKQTSKPATKEEYISYINKNKQA